MHFAYVADQESYEIKSASLHDIDDLFQSANITAETTVFNNLVKTKADFETKWKVPLIQSWHVRFLKSSVI